VLFRSPIHGLGVFTTQQLQVRQPLTEYTGDRYTLKEFKEKYGSDIHYCYVARRANYILCAKENRNIITYINESKIPNVEIKRRILRPLRVIEEGEELFLQYSKDYPRDYSLLDS
jgi:hypothetical protein